MFWAVKNLRATPLGGMDNGTVIARVHKKRASFTVHFYTFRPPAPTVRTGTADAERWSGRPRMACGKGVRVPLGIGSRF